MSEDKHYGNESDYNIRIKIPDGSPKQQLKHVNGMIKVFKTLAKATGEDVGNSLKPLEEAKKDLVKQLSNTQRTGEEEVG